MTLHFSHIGLTEGLTFTFVSPERWSSVRLWRPRGRRYRTEARHAAPKDALRAHPARIAGEAGPDAAPQTSASISPQRSTEPPRPDACDVDVVGQHQRHTAARPAEVC